MDFERQGKEYRFVKNTNTLLHDQIQFHGDGWSQLEPRKKRVRTRASVCVRRIQRLLHLPFSHKVDEGWDGTPSNQPKSAAGRIYIHTHTHTDLLRYNSTWGSTADVAVRHPCLPIHPPSHPPNHTHTQINFHWQIFWHTNSRYSAILSYTQRLRIFGRFVD